MAVFVVVESFSMKISVHCDIIITACTIHVKTVGEGRGLEVPLPLS